MDIVFVVYIPLSIDHPAMINAFHRLIDSPSINLFLAADKRRAFGSGDISGVSSGEIGSWAMFAVERDHDTLVDQVANETVVLFLGTVAPMDIVGFEKGLLRPDPVDQFQMSGRGRVVVHGGFLGMRVLVEGGRGRDGGGVAGKESLSGQWFGDGTQ